MTAPKTVVYCSKCGNGILVNISDEPVKIPPCRHCHREYTCEAFRAGRASAITELCTEPDKEIE